MTPSIALLLSAAQQPAPAGGGSGMSAFLLQMTLIFGLAYFLFIRPQQRQRKAHEERVKALKRGDEIMTSGGLIGEVVHISVGSRDGAPIATLDDRITIKSGESRLVVERGRISKVFAPATGTQEEKQK